MSTVTKAVQNKLPTTFKIGAVSRITNIPVDTLRIWERRYSVVVPIRSDNADRLYQREDINRLTLLKMLVDRSHSIGSIAHLSNEELIERLDIHDEKNSQIKVNRDSNINPLKVAVIGDVLSLQLEHNKIVDNRIDFEGLYQTQEEYLNNKPQHPVDILVVEYPAIQEDTLFAIDDLYRQSGAKKMLIVYGFTNSGAKKLLNESRYTLVPAPITVEHLHAEIKQLLETSDKNGQAVTEVSVDKPAPTRIYSNNQLIKLSSASSTIKCECPQHLSSIILKLVQFEVYSEQCENRGLDDAKLHAYLGKMTGHARSVMEKALTEVVKAEGIEV